MSTTLMLQKLRVKENEGNDLSDLENIKRLNGEE